MALYSFCQYPIHNIEFVHGCYAILIVYQSMLMFIMSCVTSMVRPDNPGTNIGSLCFQACSSVLLVHSKGGRPVDARVVTSYTGMVLGYAGSSGYDHAPQCDWDRRQEVTSLSVHRNSCVAIRAFPDVRVRCRSSWKEVVGLDVLQCGTFSRYPISWDLQP